MSSESVCIVRGVTTKFGHGQHQLFIRAYPWLSDGAHWDLLSSSRAHTYSCMLSQASSTDAHNLTPGSHLPFTGIQMGRPPGLASTIPKHTSASNTSPAQSALLEVTEIQTVTPQPKRTTKKTMSPSRSGHWDPLTSDLLLTRREMTMVTVSLKVELQNTSSR